jgi:hypothetical protein
MKNSNQWHDHPIGCHAILINLFKKLFDQFENIKCGSIVDFIIGILFGIPNPPITSRHFQSRPMDNLSFYACSS